MGRRDRYLEELNARADDMLRAPDAPAPVREVQLTLPANMQQPGPAHRAIMLAVDQVLTMGLTHPNVESAPVGLRSAVRLLRRLEPLMLEELAKVPEAECVAMMRQLGNGLNALADSVDNGNDGRPTLLAAPQPAESPGA